MAKITPAPWIADDHQIFTAAGERIAVFGDGTARSQRETAENQANACLAAAAPDLFAALYFAMKDINELTKGRGIGGSRYRSIPLATAALARAELKK